MSKKQTQVPAEHIKAGAVKVNVPAGKDWKAEGKGVAQAFIEAEQGADQTRWTLLMRECEALSGNEPSVNAFLEGFGQVYVEKYGKDTAKVRKSEVRAVIEAYSINKEQVTNLAGTWHKRVEQSRAIRPSKGNGKGKTEKTSLTPKQAEHAAELATVADAGQAATIAYKAVQRISGIQGGELFLVNTCRASVARIKTADKVIEGMCQQVVELLDKIAEAFKAQTEKAEEGKQMAEEQSKAGNKMLKAA